MTLERAVSEKLLLLRVVNNTEKASRWKVYTKIQAEFLINIGVIRNVA